MPYWHDCISIIVLEFSVHPHGCSAGGTVCDGWHKMLFTFSILCQPSQTGPRQYYATPWYQSWPGWYQTTANLVPKSLPHGAKVATPWYQSWPGWHQTTATVVPKSLPHGAKVATRWYQSLPHGAKVAAHWYQSLSLVPNENLLGAKVQRAYHHQLQLVYPKMKKKN